MIQKVVLLLRSQVILQPCKEKRLFPGPGTAFWLLFTGNYFPYLIEACAAASLAIGTLNGEQLT